MGRIKELQEQIYLSASQNDIHLEQPIFFGLMDIIKSLTSSAEQNLFNDVEAVVEEFDPNQLRLFTAEAI